MNLKTYPSRRRNHPHSTPYTIDKIYLLHNLTKYNTKYKFHYKEIIVINKANSEIVAKIRNHPFVISNLNNVM